MKICFIGAGSTVFAKNVLGDVLLTPSLCESEIALYDIDAKRLGQNKGMLERLNVTMNGGKAKITAFCGTNRRKAAIKGSDFIVTAIQVGGYDPCTITDFEIPKKYGLRQTIADTIGIGGIMRALRSLPVFESIGRDIERAAPNAWLLNYVNPMAMITGFMQRYTNVKTVGLCHSVQVCVPQLLESLGMQDKIQAHKARIAGINHMAWLLEIFDKNNTDLYPEIKRRAAEKSAKEKHTDMVRFEYIRRLGYYCTESSEHNAEYTPFFIKQRYPDLIEKYTIPLDEYPRRCLNQITEWEQRSKSILKEELLTHTRSNEYASWIMDAITTNTAYSINGNVINNGLIDNLPQEACVEVPCLVNANGVTPCKVGRLPLQLAAMNMTNCMPQLLTIQAHITKKREAVYQAAMLDPHTAGELSLDDIIALCDDIMTKHADWLPPYR